MRVASPVLNGEVAETGLRVPRRDLTQPTLTPVGIFLPTFDELFV